MPPQKTTCAVCKRSVLRTKIEVSSGAITSQLRLGVAYLPTLTQVRNELLGIVAVENGLRLAPERPNGRDISGHIVVVVHPLRVIGRENSLRGRQLCETDAHPLAPVLGSVTAP
jgi:hypothetical protein